MSYNDGDLYRKSTQKAFSLKLLYFILNVFVRRNEQQGTGNQQQNKTYSISFSTISARSSNKASILSISISHSIIVSGN